MDLAQTKKTALDSSTLEDIFSSWYNKVDSQSDAFKKHAKRLKLDELSLYDSISTLESLNQYSESVTQDYGTTLGAMQDLAKQQEHLMNSLDKIEDDIDTVLRSKTQGISTLNRIRGSFNPEDHDVVERGNYRQQMHLKAHSVNTNLDKVEDTINSLSKVLSVDGRESAQAETDGHTEIGKVLNQSYDSLSWIQDTAYDLNYQIQLLERDIEEL
mgnify:CR=1 FL=1